MPKRAKKIKSRVKALLSRMTLEEKISQMSLRMAAGDDPATAARLNNEAQQQAIAASRHRIPLMMSRETSHGMNTAGVTSFPACIALASSWDGDLNFRIGQAIAREARAQGVHQGLSPVLDIARDPRWGRMEETYGEDVHLVSRLGVAFIVGMQGDDLKDGIVATPKHLVGYGASEGGKDNDPITISERDLHETYLPPFEAAFREADARSVMICYGAVNGIPCTSDERVVSDLLKKWDFDGHVIDDCPGIAGLLGHHAAASIDEAIALGINAGIDQQFYDFIGEVPNALVGQEKFEKVLLKLVREGKVSKSRINEAARRVLTQKFRLGLFDEVMVEVNRAEEVANDPALRALAREAAVKGIVLLKNDDKILPLDVSKLKTIAVIGPNAATGQIGDYSGKPSHIVSPLEGIQDALSGKAEVLYAKGCEILSPALIGARFSVRITGSLRVDRDDTYILQLTSNGGARLKLDGKTIIDDWTPGPMRPRTTELQLAKGDHDLVVEYFRGTKFMNPDPEIERRNRNELQLAWSSASMPQTVIRTDNLTYRGALGTQQHGSGEGLLMQPFLGTEFDQPLPEQNRVIREINFNWGDRSPILAGPAESSQQESITAAVDIAKQSDVALVFVGETSDRGPQQVCGEHFDRADISLTGAQQQLVDAILATGKPVVVVLVNGRALAVPKIAATAGALLEAWYPGQEGGHAIADVLFGKISPSGKLPVSIPHSAGHLPVYYNRRPRMGWYIDAKSEPLYPFGFGQTYLDATLAKLKINPARGKADHKFTVSAEVENQSDRAGDEVVQLYVTDKICTFCTPTKRLVAFQRITLQPREKRAVTFKLPKSAFEQLDSKMKPRVEAGEFEVLLGFDSVNGLTGSIVIDDAKSARKAKAAKKKKRRNK